MNIATPRGLAVSSESVVAREEKRIVALSLALSLVITLTAWFVAMTAT